MRLLLLPIAPLLVALLTLSTPAAARHSAGPALVATPARAQIERLPPAGPGFHLYLVREGAAPAVGSSVTFALKGRANAIGVAALRVSLRFPAAALRYRRLELDHLWTRKSARLLREGEEAILTLELDAKTPLSGWLPIAALVFDAQAAGAVTLSVAPQASWSDGGSRRQVSSVRGLEDEVATEPGRPLPHRFLPPSPSYSANTTPGYEHLVPITIGVSGEAVRALTVTVLLPPELQIMARRGRVLPPNVDDGRRPRSSPYALVDGHPTFTFRNVESSQLRHFYFKTSAQAKPGRMLCMAFRSHGQSGSWQENRTSDACVRVIRKLGREI